MKKFCIVLSVLVGLYLISAVVAWLIVPKMCADMERRLFVVRLEPARVEQGQILLSQRIRAITEQTLGKGGAKEQEVAALLADPDINRLAHVYLGADWAIQRSGLLGAVSHLRDQFSLQKHDRESVQKRMDKRKADLERRVKELERRKRNIVMRIGMVGNHSNGRISIQAELDDVERQLKHCRDMRDHWDAEAWTDVRRDKIDETFAEAHTKMESEVFRVVSEYQNNTVGTLSRVMAERLARLKVEANKPDRLRRFMSVFNIWPLNRISRMPLGEEDAGTI